MTARRMTSAWQAIAFTTCLACVAHPASTFAQGGQTQEHGAPGAPDPREDLKAGVYDAGQAAHNVELVATVPKPPGFVAFVAPPPGHGPYTMHSAGGAPGTDPAELAFTNSDMAFQGTYLFLGNMNGIKLLRYCRPGEAHTRHFARLPRRTGRRFGI